jgi:hypothetical protein
MWKKGLGSQERTWRERFEWDGVLVSILEAIELAKQLREEKERYKRFGNQKKTERASRGVFGESGNLITVAHFDPEVYRKKAQASERKALKLSAMIEAKNHTVEIPFDADLYMNDL